MLQSIAAAKTFSKKLEAAWDNNTFNVFQSKITPTQCYFHISTLFLKQRGILHKRLSSTVSACCHCKRIWISSQLLSISRQIFSQCMTAIKSSKSSNLCQSFKVQSCHTICILVKYKYTGMLKWSISSKCKSIWNAIQQVYTSANLCSSLK